MATEMPALDAPEAYTWTDEDTATFVRWRVAHKKVFSGGRMTNARGYKMFLEERGLVGRVTTAFLKKKWENLNQKYKELKNPATGVTEGDETSAASWKWFYLMREAAEETRAPTTPTATRTSTVSTPKRRRVDVVDVLQEMRSQDEAEWRALQAEERERQERKEAERARQAGEREEREERRYKELVERQERLHQEAQAKEDRWREEMRLRDERRDQEAAARDERLLAILEKLVQK